MMRGVFYYVREMKHVNLMHGANQNVFHARIRPLFNPLQNIYINLILYNHMPKIKKIKKIIEIPSKIKIIEPSKEESELEGEIQEEELENFAEFIQGPASTEEEIAPIL